MCGITGLFDVNFDSNAQHDRNAVESVVTSMCGALQHRGPDSSGVWQDENVPLVLGHRRLAIVDLSEHGHQPMHSPHRRYSIVYNGEIYNFLDIKRRLEDLGYVFTGHSDTEVLLAAIEHWGINTALQKINGMFSIALWDSQRKELHLVRDRFGKKPLYVGWVGSQIVFASELKAFAAHPAFNDERAVSQDVLALYMRLSYVPAPYCIYKNIWQLPAGHRVTLRSGEVKAGQDLSTLFEMYFDAGSVLQEAKDQTKKVTLDTAVEALEEEMHAAVERRLISDVPLGAFLSGGIDSSLVVAMMQKQMKEPVKTFSIGFNEKKYNEAEHAKAIAEYLGTEHTEYYVDSDAVRQSLDKMADIYDEPFADASQIPTYMVAAKAAQDVTVVLTGDGGDEMFAGYKRHFEAPAIWRKIRWLPLPARKALRGLLNRVLPASKRCGNARINRLLEVLDAPSLRAFYDGLSQQWHDTDVLVKDSRRLPMFADKFDDALAGLKAEEKMVYWDVLSHLPDRMMVKVDRATMASSIESRAPFMDVNLFKLGWRLPLKHKVKDGKGKFVVRELLARYIPRDLFERPKQGFTPPLNEWLKTDLHDLVSALVSDEALKANQYFDLSYVEDAWKRVQVGSEADTLRIWNFVMFHLWHKRWMEA